MNVNLGPKYLAYALAAGLAVSAGADSPDGWVTTKAKIALLTADDVSVSAVNVDTVNGAVTLHGKVKSEGEKERAAAAVRKVDGVKSVRNLLQVVPEETRKSVKVADDAIKDGVENAFKGNQALSDVKVQSVNNGVVLLAGKTATLGDKLRAIELAWDVSGVQRVSSEIEAGER